MIKNILSDYSGCFNAELPKFFEAKNRVTEAMHYSVANGGKRLRPFLVYETAKLFGIGFEKSLNVAASLEFLHSYSLIHDDLPAMDDDDLRRGKPTCHKQFDEATAILAGDGLLTYAFELLAMEEKCAELVKLLGSAAGAVDGMVAGQMLDLVKASSSSESVVKKIEEMKTGRLIRYACEAGAVLGGANAEERKVLVDYARAIGIAFQIKDDILDVEGDQALMGKKLNKDSIQGKTTFVSLYGIEKASLMAADLVKQAKDVLSVFGEKTAVLKMLADYIIERKS